MSIYESMLSQQRERGRADALDLRQRAPEMTDAEVIAEQSKVPVFNPEKDYSEWPIGAPVKELVDGEYKVFRMIAAPVARSMPGTPSTTPDVWRECVAEEPAVEAE